VVVVVVFLLVDLPADAGRLQPAIDVPTGTDGTGAVSVP
jgi:hypothetical protein